MNTITCPECGATVRNNGPHIRLHLAVSHSGKTPVIEMHK